MQRGPPSPCSVRELQAVAGSVPTHRIWSTGQGLNCLSGLVPASLWAACLSPFVSGFPWVNVGSSPQDDVMMPQRVRLQLEAAVRHPTSVSANVWPCVVTASDEIVLTAFSCYLFIFLVKKRPAYD